MSSSFFPIYSPYSLTLLVNSKPVYGNGMFIRNNKRKWRQLWQFEVFINLDIFLRSPKVCSDGISFSRDTYISSLVFSLMSILCDIILCVSFRTQFLRSAVTRGWPGLTSFLLKGTSASNMVVASLGLYSPTVWSACSAKHEIYDESMRAVTNVLSSCRGRPLTPQSIPFPH